MYNEEKELEDGESQGCGDGSGLLHADIRIHSGGSCFRGFISLAHFQKCGHELGSHRSVSRVPGRSRNHTTATAAALTLMLGDG